MEHADIERIIEQEMSSVAGVDGVVEIQDGAIVISGMVASESARQAALDVAVGLVPDMEIVDNLEISAVLPARIGDLHVSEAEAGSFPVADAGTGDSEALEPGDFTDQRLLQDASNEMGPASREHGFEDEDVLEGEDVYVPPMDPVMGPDGEVLGGFSLSSMDDVAVERSSFDGQVGDEAIADAVRRELSEDSLTTGLAIQVLVRQGIVHLRGRVDDVLDVENAEEVAARVPGVVQVEESLDVVRNAF